MTGTGIHIVDAFPDTGQRITREVLEVLSECQHPFGLITKSALIERDIIIRDVGIPHTLRVTAGTEAETTAFLVALSEIGR